MPLAAPVGFETIIALVVKKISPHSGCGLDYYSEANNSTFHLLWKVFQGFHNPRNASSSVYQPVELCMLGANQSRSHSTIFFCSIFDVYVCVLQHLYLMNVDTILSLPPGLCAFCVCGHEWVSMYVMWMCVCVCVCMCIYAKKKVCTLASAPRCLAPRSSCRGLEEKWRAQTNSSAHPGSQLVLSPQRRD